MSEPTRDQFEAWISAPPFERSIARYPENFEYAWPGCYRDIDVELAWEAWREAFAAGAKVENEALRKLLSNVRDLFMQELSALSIGAEIDAAIDPARRPA